MRKPPGHLGEQSVANCAQEPVQRPLALGGGDAVLGDEPGSQQAIQGEAITSSRRRRRARATWSGRRGTPLRSRGARATTETYRAVRHLEQAREEPVEEWAVAEYERSDDAVELLLKPHAQRAPHSARVVPSRARLKKSLVRAQAHHMSLATQLLLLDPSNHRYQLYLGRENHSRN